MKNLYYTLLVITLLYSCKNTSQVYNVQNYGCTGNKEKIITTKLQRLIDKAADKGGGVIYFPQGEYTTGQIELRSNITIHLEAGAVIYASTNNADYKNLVTNYKADDQIKTPNKACLFNADSVENITFSGLGIINGQSEQTWEDLKEIDNFIKNETENAKISGIEMKRAYQKDPKIRLIYIMNSKNIVIENITMKDSRDWTCHFGNCSEINVKGIKLYSSLEKGVNADGIDIDGCKNVRISDCIVETGDDAICLKTTLRDGAYTSCENVVVNNCILTSTSTALKLGTESHGDFKHILFSDCVIRNSNRGMSIVVRDGANVSDVMFTNITVETSRKHFNWWGNGDAIWVVLLKRKPESRLGSIKNIVFSNIISKCEGTSKIEGYEGKMLENIKLENVQFYMTQESQKDKRTNNVFYAHDVQNLEINDVKLVWDTTKIEAKWTTPFKFKNISDLFLNQMKGRQPFDKGNFIELEEINNALISNCYTSKGTDNFLSLSGAKNANIYLQNNYLHYAKNAVLYVNGANTSMTKSK